MKKQSAVGLAIVSAVGLAVVANAIVAIADPDPEPLCKWDNECKCEVGMDSHRGTASVPAGWSIGWDQPSTEDNGCCDKIGTDCSDDHNCDWAGQITVTANEGTTWRRHFGGITDTFRGSYTWDATLNAKCKGDPVAYSFSMPNSQEKFWHLTISCKDCAAVPD